MRFKVTAPIIMLLAGTAAIGQPPAYNGDDNWKQVCKQARAQPIQQPALDEPIPADQIAKCDAQTLYYGIGQKPDYTAALQCGWYQRAHPDPDGDIFEGPGVLSMLYANGLSVPRNYSLAIRFACEMGDKASLGEMAGRIGHLEYLRNANTPNAKFDVCDDITSGLSEGYCTSTMTRGDDAIESRQVAAIVAKLPAAAELAFPRLQAAEKAFEDARTGNEVDLSGTGRNAFAEVEQDRLQEQFLINLQRFGRGDIPAATDSELTALDQQLNETYQRLLREPASNVPGSVGPEGIRATERTWLQLADAWGEFARRAYPTLTPTRVRAQLIRLRLHQLRSLLSGQ